MRVRANRGGLFNTSTPKRAGYKDTVYDYICSKCGKKILKKESQMSIPGEGGTKRFHWDCIPNKNKTEVLK